MQNDSFIGSLYYDTTLGKIQAYNGGGEPVPDGTTRVSNAQWGDPSNAPTANPNSSPTYNRYDANGNRITTPSGPTAAQIAENTRMANIRNNLQVSQDSAVSGARQGVNDTALSYKNSSNEFLNGIQTGQEAINQQGVNNALNLRRAISSIGQNIKTGLRSGGVTLANMNASDSGASDALARAYAENGALQFSDANNEAGLTEQQIGLDQLKLNKDKEMGVTRLNDFTTNETARIRSDLFDKLNILNTQANNDGAGGIINTSLADQIVAEALAKLQETDAQRNSTLGGVKGLTREEINALAMQKEQAGLVGTNPFAVPEGAQLTRAGGPTGAPISQLPIFARTKNKE